MPGAGGSQDITRSQLPVLVFFGEIKPMPILVFFGETKPVPILVFLTVLVIPNQCIYGRKENWGWRVTVAGHYQAVATHFGLILLFAAVLADCIRQRYGNRPKCTNTKSHQSGFRKKLLQNLISSLNPMAGGLKLGPGGWWPGGVEILAGY